MAGTIGILSQLLLTKVFQKFETTKDNAGYTAHTVVALIFVVLVSVVGTMGCWNMRHLLHATPMDRLLIPYDQCRWLATIVTGLFTLWDIPTSICIPQLRKADVVVHHIVMTVTAYLAARYIPMYYVFFYLGTSEISSIPLLMYDQLCVWTAKGSTIVNDRPSSETKDTDDGKTIQLRTAMQMIAALSFTLIRAILFTYVTLRHFIPDVLYVISSNPSVVVSTATSSAATMLTSLRFALFASLGFTALQLYWFSQMLSVMYSSIRGGKK
jgi:hypothetical protein